MAIEAGAGASIYAAEIDISEGDRPMTLPRQNSPIHPDIHANAPYNFVPLPERIVPAPPFDHWDENSLSGEGYPKCNVEVADRFTGWMEINLETKTPLYVRNGILPEHYPVAAEYVKKSLAELKEHADRLRRNNTDQEKLVESDKIKRFVERYAKMFAPGGRVRLPGSSLRGMIRSLVEVITASRPYTIGKPDLYFWRDVAGKSPSKSLYRRFFIQRNSNPFYFTTKSCAGYIVDRQMIPAVDPSSGGYYHRIEESDLISVLGATPGLHGETLRSMSLPPTARNPNYEKNDSYKWEWFLVWYQEQPATCYQHQNVMLRYAKLDLNTVRNTKPSNPAQWRLGWAVCSGWMPGRPRRTGKHMHWIVPIPDTPTVNCQVDKDARKFYMKDIERKDNPPEIGAMGFSVLPEHHRKQLAVYLDGKVKKKIIDSRERQRIEEFGVPCFYIQDSGLPGGIAFGHTPNFRIPYRHALGKMVPAEHRPKETGDSHEKTDLATLIFGTAAKEEGFAGRVFFEDAYSVDEIQQDDSDSDYPKILGSPKATCFAHYLVQEDVSDTTDQQGNTIRNLDTMVDFNASPWEPRTAQHEKSTLIRGTKFYWHHDGEREETKDNNQRGPFWKAKRSEIRDKESQYTLISPVPKETKFRGRIRFENLTKTEFGALLCAVRLPDGCAHKIGMGKPLGLGSARIDVTRIHIRKGHRDAENSEGRYQALFDMTDNVCRWHSGEETYEGEGLAEKVNDYQIHFQSELLRHLPEKRPDGTRIEDIWETYRFRELKCLLTWRDRPNPEKVEYMEPGPEGYGKRNPLPLPSEVSGASFTSQPSAVDLPRSCWTGEIPEETAETTQREETENTSTQQDGPPTEIGPATFELISRGRPKKKKKNMIFDCVDPEVVVKIKTEKLESIPQKGERLTRSGKLLRREDNVVWYRFESE